MQPVRYYAGVFSWSAGLSRTMTEALTTRKKISLKGELGLLGETVAKLSTWVIVPDETGLEVAIWLACCVWGRREELTARVVVQLWWKVFRLKQLPKVSHVIFFPVVTVLFGLCENVYDKFQPWWENDYFVWTLAIDVAFVLDSWYWSLLSAFCADSSVFYGCILKLGSHGHSYLLVCACST